jgi:shikimate dehydrogenase
MLNLGLIGYPLGHSFSPTLHAAALKAAGLAGKYRLYPIAPEDTQGLVALLDQLRGGELHGLNVTIPHKQTVIPLLDGLSPLARSIGAVNTIYVENHLLMGDNTDAPGFLADLRRSLGIEMPGKAIVMGSGGAARAVVHALAKRGWQVTLAVRRADVGQADELSHSVAEAGYGSVRHVLLEAETLAPELESLNLLVNTTPLGMSPHVETCAWPEDLAFPGGAAVYDLVYNPSETRLLKQAREAGLQAASGLGMLIEQAALAFARWTGLEPPSAVMRAAMEA